MCSISASRQISHCSYKLIIMTNFWSRKTRPLIAEVETVSLPRWLVPAICHLHPTAVFILIIGRLEQISILLHRLQVFLWLNQRRSRHPNWCVSTPGSRQHQDLTPTGWIPVDLTGGKSCLVPRFIARNPTKIFEAPRHTRLFQAELIYAKYIDKWLKCACFQPADITQPFIIHILPLWCSSETSVYGYKSTQYHRTRQFESIFYCSLDIEQPGLLRGLRKPVVLWTCSLSVTVL
jgi:hypothetical protein